MLHQLQSHLKQVGCMVGLTLAGVSLFWVLGSLRPGILVDIYSDHAV